MKIPFSEKVFENLIFLPVTCNRAEAIALFDTGAGITVLKESFARRCGAAETDASFKAGNNQGRILSLTKAFLQSLSLGNVRTAGLSCAVLPEEAFAVGKDSRRRDFPADLVLGWDFISRYCWDFDMEKRFVEVSEKGAFTSDSASHSIPLRWQNFPLLPVRYGDEELLMGFDSGHTETMLTASWSRRLPRIRQVSDTIHGLGSETERSVLQTETLPLSIGSKAVLLQNIDILEDGIPGVPDFAEGLLGADILEGCRWRLNFPGGRFQIF